VPEPRRGLRYGVAVAACLCTIVSASFARKRKAPPPTPSNYMPVTAYDAARDPRKDLQDAIVEATRTKKRILLEVGGDWCIWCHIMDNFFQDHPKLQEFRDSHYVHVKINYGKDNPNEDFLSHYPRIADYPHFFVLDSSGALLHSQDTGVFQHDRTYSLRKLNAFLKKWASARAQADAQAR
jgi:thiol:disulfide interchange protein